MPAATGKNISLYDEDFETIDRVRVRIGAAHDSQAVRYIIREWTRISDYRQWDNGKEAANGKEKQAKS